MSSTGSLSAFISGLAEALEIEESSITPDTLFDQVDWDSLAVISAIALIDEHFCVMIPQQLRQPLCTTRLRLLLG